MESGEKIRLHLSRVSAEKMAEIVSRFSELTAGTLSFNHLEATSMLKTQSICTKKPRKTNLGKEMTTVGLFSSNRVFQALTGHRAKGIRLFWVLQNGDATDRKNYYLLSARIQDHHLR